MDSALCELLLASGLVQTGTGQEYRGIEYGGPPASYAVIHCLTIVFVVLGCDDIATALID
ncbi:hypothetical protein [Mycobacterium sp. HUMS_1102779]|uniref:hypothetical protein n=1 Tax=Mycobacterium sp. HUMS_1102779 TaxID=3383487 RepID=UPI00389A31F5